jgi:N-acetylneuraminic acid mutarotase
LWLFGGIGQDSAGSNGRLNDLWRFDGVNWTWISGSDTHSATGVYGTLGVPAAANVPGARNSPLTWIDSTGNLWLFGGLGQAGQHNDLWRFDGANWSWMSGSSSIDQVGVYGTLGVPAASNLPGSRQNSATWTDAAGNFWLFGGIGQGAVVGLASNLNDLWKHDGSFWTWMGGSPGVNQAGVYGVQGTAAPTNQPGARRSPVAWKTTAGEVLMFGGHGHDATGSSGYLNDLWSFDGTQWTWKSGSNLVDQAGSYGTKGIPQATNMPGGRMAALSWIDPAGALWLFGGLTPAGRLNDLWRYTP